MLSKSQKREVLDLVAQSLDGSLSPEGQSRLRAFVAHEVPLAGKAPWPEVHYTAMYMVGVWSFTGSLEAEA